MEGSTSILLATRCTGPRIRGAGAYLVVPSRWCSDGEIQFARVGDHEARVRFPCGAAFAVLNNDETPGEGVIRVLSPEERDETPWGPLCDPWLDAAGLQVHEHFLQSRTPVPLERFLPQRENPESGMPGPGVENVA
jgi:hypothetical protein